LRSPFDRGLPPLALPALPGGSLDGGKCELLEFCPSFSVSSATCRGQRRDLRHQRYHQLLRLADSRVLGRDRYVLRRECGLELGDSLLQRLQQQRLITFRLALSIRLFI
jgi:hypothetical protein